MDSHGGGMLGWPWEGSRFTLCAPQWPSDGGVGNEQTSPMDGRSLALAFTAPALECDERFASRLITARRPSIVVCDVHPKGIGLPPHLRKVCEEGRTTWPWFVNAASLGPSKSRKRKLWFRQWVCVCELPIYPCVYFGFWLYQKA